MKHDSTEIPADVARSIYMVLVRYCGAAALPECRNDFINALKRGTTEYRFQGNLGFGGKFYCERSHWRVSCYREDETPSRLKGIDEANDRLADLRTDFYSAQEIGP